MAYGLHMPVKPMCQPRGPVIRELIRNRGYTIAGFSRKINHPQSVDTIRNICLAKSQRCSVEFIRKIAKGLSTPRRPVKPSDISDWTGDDDLYDDEPRPKALAS
jgi:hypothetical protein